MAEIWDIGIDIIFIVAFAGLAVYYYYLIRSNVAKLLVIAALLSTINDFTSYIVDPSKPNLFLYASQALDLILYLLLIFSFYLLYKKSIEGLEETREKKG
ncbi:MAG: hypothetical protein ACYS8Y_13685 [Planctomycetota bacterium]|jgi:hypothetical protein